MLAHLLGQQDLSQRIIDLVRPRMVEVFALEIDLRPILLTETACVVEGAGSPNIVTQQGVVLFLELPALDDREVHALQLSDDGLEDGWDKGPTEAAIKAIGIYLKRCHKRCCVE